MYIEEQIEELRRKLTKMEMQLHDLSSINRLRRSDDITSTSNCDIVYTVKDVSKILKTTTGYVYSLIKTGYLPALKLGCMKIRRQALCEFLAKYEGKDLTNPNEIKDLDIKQIEQTESLTY